MKTAKLLFYVVVLFLAIIGGFAVFGALAWIVQYVFWLAAILLVGYLGVKLLTKKKPEHPQLKTSPEERELQDALRRIEEIKRAQLPR
jgi:threonine/homoserine/homoserine lactone efflux protein